MFDQAIAPDGPAEVLYLRDESGHEAITRGPAVHPTHQRQDSSVPQGPRRSRRRRALAVTTALCTGLALTACSTSGPSSVATDSTTTSAPATTTTDRTASSSTTSSPSTTSSTTTTTAPTTTTTTTLPPAGPIDQPSITATRAGGSGCTPGPGPLPDGWWFGTTDASIRAGTTFQFDLACYYTGRRAAEVAHEEDPARYPSATSIENDVYISNQNPALRPVTVAATAAIRCIDVTDGAVAFDDQRPCSGTSGEWSVWVRVDDGRATAVLEQFQP